ncbi:MAG: glycosyltransferase family 2 protein [Leptospiraceae bacterium]|nr:glycosyltransferase family 2 protein [Leptospiraceae bacterium]
MKDKLFYKIKFLIQKIFFILNQEGFFRLVQRISASIRFRTKVRFFPDWVYQKHQEAFNKHIEARKLESKEILRKVANLDSLPYLSIIIPVYNTNPDFLKRAIDSVLNSTYKNWELILVNDASIEAKTLEVLNNYKNQKQIKILHRKENGHICNATNDGIREAGYDWIVFMDHDDVLLQDALLYIADQIIKNKDLWLLYSDEAYIDHKDRIIELFFKPDWSPERFRRQNYINHLTVIRKEKIIEVGFLRPGFEGSQDHDLVIRILEKLYKTKHFESEKYIYHVSKILYLWRIDNQNQSSFSQKNTQSTRNTSRKLVLEHLNRLGVEAEVELQPIDFLDIKYRIKNSSTLVSILIPTRDRIDLVKTCVESIIQHTNGINYEILILDNDSKEPETISYFNEFENSKKGRVIKIPGEFNYSYINNRGAEEAEGDYLCLLNNDIEIIQNDWLERMIEMASQEGIGAVGAKLLYPNDTIQHAGIVLGINNWAGHSFRGYKKDFMGYGGNPLLVAHECSAVTAACLVVKKSVFFEVKGFDELNLKVSCNDVDLNLRFLDLGYRNILLPNVVLYHHESASRGHEVGEKYERFLKESNFVKEKWKKYFSRDPFYNENLTMANESHSPKYVAEVNK